MNLFDALQQSGLIHRLGWGLVHSLWLGIAIAVALALALRFLRNQSANIRYLACCGAMVSLLATAIIAIVLVQPSVSDVQAVVPMPTVVLEPNFSAPAASGVTAPGFAPQISGAAPAVPIAPTPEPWLVRINRYVDPSLPWVVLTWAIGVFAMALWQLSGWMGAMRICKLATTPSEAHIVQIVMRLARAMCISRPITVLDSMIVKVPTLIGFLRPVILLPVGLATGLSTEQLEAILLHELAHIRRMDYLVNLLQRLVEAILFYHPAVWFISRQIRNERENCCDDVTLAACADPTVYAEALLAVAGPAAPRLALAATGGQLLPRIRRILGLADPGSSPSALLSGGLALLFVVGIVVVPIAMLRAADGTPTATTKSAATEPAPATGNDSPWGAAVEGVQTRLRAEKLQWKTGETPTLLADARNQGTRDLTVARSSRGFGELEIDGLWYHGTIVELMLGFDFGPGKEYTGIAYALDAAWQAKQGRIVDVLKLTPGKHTVRVAITAQPTKNGDKDVRAISNAVEIEILPADATSVPAATASPPTTTQAANGNDAPWGEAVEGVQMRLRAEKLQWKAVETPTLLADIRNQGTRDLQIARTSKGVEELEIEIDGLWYHFTVNEYGLSPIFEAGKEFPGFVFALNAYWQAEQGGKVLTLIPGKHAVRVAITAQPTNNGEKAIRGLSNAVEIEILPADATPQPKDAKAQALFQQWQADARTDGKIPGALIGKLGEKVKLFISYNKTDNPANHDLAVKFEKLLPRFDATHDWTQSDAIALLDDIATIHSMPLEITLEAAGYNTLRSGKPLPAELTDAPWGQPSPDGLRVAWLLEPRAKEYPLGTSLKSTILVHNSGKKTAIFIMPSWQQSGIQNVHDAKGAAINVTATTWTTMGVKMTYRLAPGEYCEASTAGIGVGTTKDAHWVEWRVGSWIDAKAGDEVHFSPGAVEVRCSPGVIGASGPSDRPFTVDLKDAADLWNKIIAERVERELPLPAAAADRAQVIRRVTLDLCGAAPTPDEIAAFIADDAPTAPAKLEKRLAARPGIAPFTGRLQPGDIQFGVLAAAPDAAKNPPTPIPNGLAPSMPPPATAPPATGAAVAAPPEGTASATQAAATTQPAVSSKPAVKDGLQVTVTLPKTTFAADEPPKFTVQFKNVSDKPFALADVDWFWDWTIYFKDEARHGPWKLENLYPVFHLSAATIKPGETMEVTVDLGNKDYLYDFTWAGRVAGQAILPIKRLNPGKYRLSIEIPLKQPPPSKEEAEQDGPFWTGTIKTEPVEFQISDWTAATQAATALPATASAPAVATAMTEEQVVAEIEKLGGTIRRTGDKPDGPVIAVGFFPPSNTKVTNAVLEHLKIFSELQYLDLNDTIVTDAGLENLKGLSNLKGLLLIGTKVTDEGVKKFKEALPKCDVFLHDDMGPDRRLDTSPTQQPPAATQPATAPAMTPAMTEEQVVAEIEKLGGKVTRDGNAPDGLVVAVTFAPIRIGRVPLTRNEIDAVLEHLNGLTQLKSVDLSFTEVSDAGLEQLQRLNQLQTLNLENTKVTDAGLKNLKGLNQLQKLDLDDTQVTDAGLEQLTELNQLQELSLNRTNVTDAGLAHLQGLHQLQGLFLGGDKVTDTGAEQLKGLKQLQVLYLTGTKVTDAGLAYLAGLSQLQHLNLMGTNVTDAGLEHLQGLTQLQTLFLSGTKVTDAGLAHLEGLKQLQMLILQKLGVTDAGLSHLAGLNQLRTLDLSGTNITDAGLAHLEGLHQLLWLGLGQSNVTDVGLEHLKVLNQLEWVDLQSTKVTDQGIKQLEDALPKWKLAKHNP